MEQAGLLLQETEYEYITPDFLKRFSTLVDGLDPLGLWRKTYAHLIGQCLAEIDTFLGRMSRYLEKEHRDMVTDALFVSFGAHGLTLRKSNDALFFQHPLATADYLARHRLDAATLAAALLHDVAEDTVVSISQIVQRFGPEVGKLVDGVTKLQATSRQVASQLKQEEIGIESINKLFRFMVDDVRVVLVKLADRLHNMKTLASLPVWKQWEKAHEVLEVYAPLAYRLGMWDVKSELEGLALQVLRPALHEELEMLMVQRSEMQRARLQTVSQTLLERLAEVGVSARIEFSPEHIYSIYQRFIREGWTTPRISNVLRIAVIVTDRCDCYKVLCAAHKLWKPLPGTFDDYIAHPRENLYRSLHTTVFGPGGELKIRIRTEEMHQVAHQGILVRWSVDIHGYRKGLDRQVFQIMERLKPVGHISEAKARLAAYREALTDQILVFTPEGEQIELPAGSTPVDFAYQIHSTLGDETRGVQINGVPCPLNTRLRNADRVKIIRVEGELPRREWLDEDLGFVWTTYTRNRIRRAFRHLNGTAAVSVGWEALHREMSMMGLDDYDLPAIAEDLEYESAEALLVAIARAELTPYVIAHWVMAAEWDALEADQVADASMVAGSSVMVRGVPNLETRLCKACRPTPGDPIIGNLLRGGEVTVHRMDCPHIALGSEHGQRQSLLEVEWGEKPRLVRPVHICMAAVDRPGLTFDVAKIVEAEDINFRQLFGAGGGGTPIGVMAATIEMTDLRQLSRVMHRLSQLPNLIAVQRVAEFPADKDVLLEWAAEQIQES